MEYLFKGHAPPVAGTPFFIDSSDNFQRENAVIDKNGRAIVYYPRDVSAILS